MILILMLACVGAVTATALGILGGRRVLRGSVADGHHDVLVPIFLTAGTIYAVFLAFIVVAVWESYNDAKTNIADEASSLTTMYRASTGMETAPGDALRHLIRDYTKAVIDDEWQVQAARAGASQKARAAAVSMYRLIGHEPTQVRAEDASINDQVLAMVTKVQTDRNVRTLQASESVSGVMWLAVIGGGAIVVSMTFVLYMEAVWLQIMLSGVMTLMIAVLLCITYLLSHPFQGVMALQAEPFEHSMSVYDVVDLTP